MLTYPLPCQLVLLAVVFHEEPQKKVVKDQLIQFQCGASICVGLIVETMTAVTVFLDGLASPKFHTSSET